MRGKMRGVKVASGCVLLALLAFQGISHVEASEVAVSTIILESRGESFKGQVAVGEVIRTRAKKRGLTFTEVCLQAKQFSCWNDREEARYKLARIADDIKAVARRAWVASARTNYTNSSDHYFADYIDEPYWAKVMQVKAVIGKHIFLGRD